MKMAYYDPNRSRSEGPTVVITELSQAAYLLAQGNTLVDLETYPSTLEDAGFDKRPELRMHIQGKNVIRDKAAWHNGACRFQHPCELAFLINKLSTFCMVKRWAV
jgi:hypothetical protein